MTELSPKSREILGAAARAGGPTRANDLRVRRGLEVQLGIAMGLTATTTAVGSAAAATTAAGAGAMVAAKVVAGLLVLAGLGGGVGAYYSHARRSAVTKSGLSTADRHEPALIPMASPTSTVPPSAAVAPSTPASSRTDGAAPAHPVARATASTSLALPGSDASSALKQETRLLREADGALRSGDSSLALTLLERHAQEFPNGMLAEERAVEMILALCASGRQREARSAAAAFLRAHRQSPATSRVLRSCAGAEAEPGRNHP